MAVVGRERERTLPNLRPLRPVWIPSPEVSDEHVSALTRELRLPAALCRILAVRGIVEPDAAKRFLRPRLDQLGDPSTLADGERAAERIAQAVRARERILVHGDYDVDGICATALLTRWLRELGGDVVPFVPHRVRDGYDFSHGGLAAARAAGASLVVTADCGTVAHEAVAAAVAEGRDVIVTDHHTVGEALPPAHAVVNPQRPDCVYPGKTLCGTGLAYRLCELVASALGADAGELPGYLDLVALATVADLVPLVGDNRVLVAHGLRRFRESRVPGITALLAAAGVDPLDVTSGQLGFVVAPRINAAGRIGESADALRLLLTDDPSEAGAIAARLEAINEERREIDGRTLDEALDLLGEAYDADRDYGVVLAGEGWHPGVIGIVASRLVERIHRPVVLVALDGGRGRGSARSIPGFHLYEALAACAGHLDRFGGHRQAAGMDVRRECVPLLRDAFNAEARRRLGPDDLHPRLAADVTLDPSEIDLDLVHWLRYLGPHGIGNPGPVFHSTALRVEGAREVGRGHLKARLERGAARLEAIGFGLRERFAPDGLAEAPHDALFRLERNEWRGRVSAQARLLDLRPSVSG